MKQDTRDTAIALLTVLNVTLLGMFAMATDWTGGGGGGAAFDGDLTADVALVDSSDNEVDIGDTLCYNPDSDATCDMQTLTGASAGFYWDPDDDGDNNVDLTLNSGGGRIRWRNGLGSVTLTAQHNATRPEIFTSEAEKALWLNAVADLFLDGDNDNDSEVLVSDTDITFDGRVIWESSGTSCADTGDGLNCTATVTPDDSTETVTCLDTQGCDITLGEAGMTDGAVVVFRCITAAGPCNFADTDGVQNLSGALVLGDDDTLVVQYMTDEWVQLATSNN